MRYYLIVTSYNVIQPLIYVNKTCDYLLETILHQQIVRLLVHNRDITDDIAEFNVRKNYGDMIVRYMIITSV